MIFGESNKSKKTFKPIINTETTRPSTNAEYKEKINKLSGALEEHAFEAGSQPVPAPTNPTHQYEATSTAATTATTSSYHEKRIDGGVCEDTLKDDDDNDQMDIDMMNMDDTV